MTFPDKYVCFKMDNPSFEGYKLIPIRYEDRIPILKWRNEQMYHLRQDKVLTNDAQDNYFQNVVNPLFTDEKPSQILFSFLKDGKCIGYGGLVHISWEDRNAELSFIMDTKFEKDNFHEIWNVYLKLIEEVAFEQVNLHKIYVYAFDLRPHLYIALEYNGFRREARLKEHKFFQGKLIDIVIHSKVSIS